MERVILLGTTVGTRWRQTVTSNLVTMGVSPGRIVNPHLSKNTKWTLEHAKAERAIKRDPTTLILIYICPGVVNEPYLSEEVRAYKAEILGAVSMKEVGQYGWAHSQRTAIVFELGAFTAGGRPQKNLLSIRDELLEDFGGNGPYFVSLADAIAWIAPQLAKN